MSSLPGITLEDFISWDLGVVCENIDGNESLRIAEALGTANDHRPRLSSEQFKELVNLYEPFRADIEDRLRAFDEESMSWRDYAGYAFDFIPQWDRDRALKWLQSEVVQ